MCYFVTCLAQIVKCVKILGEVGRGFFTSVGLEVFLRKNLVSITSIALFREISAVGQFRNAICKQGLSLFSRKVRKSYNTIHPLLCLCTLLSNRWDNFFFIRILKYCVSFLGPGCLVFRNGTLYI